MRTRGLSLKARAVAWLAQREHSRAELRRKLLELLARQARAAADDHPADTVYPAHPADPVDPADIAAVGSIAPTAPPPTEQDVETLLDSLAAQGLLSDERFTESRIHVRAPRYGNLRIRQEVSQHGVALDADTAQALQASEMDRARAVWARRYSGPAPDAAGRARQARFLTARGFSADAVRRVLREAGAESSQDEAVTDGLGNPVGDRAGDGLGEAGQDAGASPARRPRRPSS